MYELKEKFENSVFNYNLCGLCVNAKVKRVVVTKDKIIIFFDGGVVDVYPELLEEVKLKNTIWCYKLKNFLGDELGFLSKIKD